MAVFHRIHPEPGELSAEEAASSFGPAASAPAERPYLGLNMVATADGKATIDGRSGPIGNKADRELFHELRGQVDAVMAGAGTVRTERYGRSVKDGQEDGSAGDQSDDPAGDTSDQPSADNAADDGSSSADDSGGDAPPDSSAD